MKKQPVVVALLLIVLLVLGFFLVKTGMSTDSATPPAVEETNPFGGL